MRFSVILTTIIFGGLIGGMAFFVLNPGNGEQDRKIRIKSPRSDLAARSDLGAAEQAAFLLPVAETNYLPIRDFNVAEPVVNARAAALFDTRSGRILYARNADQRLPIASITKLMTAVAVVENLNLEEIFTVTAETVNVDGTGADLFKDERLYGRDLLKMFLIKSSNDAALTFAVEAQKIGIDIVELMNKKAQELAMYNTHFGDPSGLDDYNSFSTASDLVKLISYASRYSEIVEIMRMSVADVYSADRKINHHLVNTNRLLGQLDGLIFGKTGYTDKAFGTMAIMTTINNGRDRLISVVLGAQDRFGETTQLIEWAKGAYRWE